MDVESMNVSEHLETVIHVRLTRQNLEDISKRGGVSQTNQDNTIQVVVSLKKDD